MVAEEYKPIRAEPRKHIEASSEITALHEEVANISADLSKMRDPVVQGSLLFKLQQERENSNRLLKTILETLDSRLSKMEEKISSIEKKMGAAAPVHAESRPDDLLLPSVDGDIVSFVRSKGNACAEDVRVNFRYRGKNAASSRLNHLFELGVLEKRQAGRKVYYRVK